MARPGYIEARNRLDKAKLDLANAEVRITEVDSLPYSEQLRESHRSDAQKALDRYRLALAEAEQAFAAFSRPKHTTRTEYFYTRIPTVLSVSKEMYDAIRRECEANSITIPELIRRALAPYLGLEVQCLPKP